MSPKSLYIFSSKHSQYIQKDIGGDRIAGWEGIYSEECDLNMQFTYDLNYRVLTKYSFINDHEMTLVFKIRVLTMELNTYFCIFPSSLSQIR